MDFQIHFTVTMVHPFLQMNSQPLQYEFEHVTSSPEYPQSNGKVENAVKTAKNLMKKSSSTSSDFHLALLDWRNTPTEGMKSSPAQRMFGRRTRTLLPSSKKLLKPQLVTDVRCQCSHTQRTLYSPPWLLKRLCSDLGLSVFFLCFYFFCSVYAEHFFPEHFSEHLCEHFIVTVHRFNFFFYSSSFSLKKEGKV